MKNNLLIITVLVVILNTTTLFAQGWQVTGNALNSTGQIGSTNAQDVKFISNNIASGILTKDGLWGFGTKDPNSKLHINTFTGQNGLRVQISGSTKFLVNSAGGVSVGSASIAPPNGLLVSGNTGIGTTSPLSKLHVQTGSSGISPFFQSVVTAESSTNTYMNILAPSVNETGILFGNNSSSVSGGIIYNSAFQGSAPNALQFRTNGNFPRMVLTAAGQVGIGTTAPLSKLHALSGGSGAIPIANTVITAENSTSSYVSLLAPSSTETGIIFGHNANAASGGIIYNNPSLKNGFQFRTNGNITRMVLSTGGRLGIGALDPGIFKVRIVQDFGGLALEDINGVNWEFAIGFPVGNLNLLRGGIAKGFFDSNTGQYFTFSDMRLKTNIQPMAAVLEKISQLKPSAFQLIHIGNKQYYNGFIAQDVMKIFPDLVFHNVEEKRKIDLYSLNYSGFGVIAIKGIQELIKTNEESRAEIDCLKYEIQNLKSEIHEIKTVVFKNAPQTGMNNQSISLSSTPGIEDISLQQNTPNPFSDITTIHYTVPKKFTSAQIIITDVNGKTLKQVNLQGSGKGILNIDASMLSPGSFSYSLIVDGKITRTKQMLLVK